MSSSGLLLIVLLLEYFHRPDIVRVPFIGLVPGDKGDNKFEKLTGGVLTYATQRDESTAKRFWFVFSLFGLRSLYFKTAPNIYRC